MNFCVHKIIFFRFQISDFILLNVSCLRFLSSGVASNLLVVISFHSGFGVNISQQSDFGLQFQTYLRLHCFVFLFRSSEASSDLRRQNYETLHFLFAIQDLTCCSCYVNVIHIYLHGCITASGLFVCSRARSQQRT